MANIRYYSKQFAGLLPTVFTKRSYFSKFGPMQSYDGVLDNQTAFTLKTNNIPVTIRAYNTGAAIAFGNGTAGSSRFGNRTEIIYQNTDVQFLNTWAFHEGIDRFTVNNSMDIAIAERLVLQAEALMERTDQGIAAYIATNAVISQQLTAYTSAAVLTLFNTLDKLYTNAKVVGQKVAAVNSDIYNLIVEHPLTVKEKDGGANIADNYIYKFKDFIIDKVPDSSLPVGNVALIYVAGMGAVFNGIQTTRTIESEDFDGVALQGAGKDGVFTLAVNFAALGKITPPTP